MHLSDLHAQLAAFHTDYPEEAQFLHNTRLFVALAADTCWQRSHLAGHLTASAWVLSADRSAALLLHHRKLDRWLQPGGHVDDTDASLLDATRREVAEECGLTDLALLYEGIFDLDVHPIPAKGAEPAHWHYDVRFLLGVKNGLEKTERNLLETKGLEWVSLPSLCSADTPQSLRRMALKTARV
jgi:8-oxo-dGTP pyrophosphatase MutT (NUDIX family)